MATNKFVARNGIVALSDSTITGSLDIAGNLTTTGTITAQKLVVQQVTSSVVYSSGSNVFGNSLSNTQSMTGSVGITGSLSVNGVSTIGSVIGTTNYVPRFTSANVIGNSQIQDNGTFVSVGYATNPALHKLDVNGTGRFSDTISTTNGTVNMIMSYGTAGVIGTQSNHDLQIRTNNTAKLTIDSTGAATFFSSVSAGTDGVFGSSRTANNAGATFLNIIGSSSSSTSAELRLTQVWNGLNYPIFLRNTYNTTGAASSVFTISTTRFISPSPVTIERFRIDGETGNVGIGTDSTTSKLEVQTAITTGYSSTVIPDGYLTVRNKHNSGGTNQYSSLVLAVSANNGSSNGIVSISAVAPTSGASTADFVFQTRNAGVYGERMRITSSGNVGIGTDSPVAKLAVSDNNSTVYASSSTSLAFPNSVFGISNSNTTTGSSSIQFFGVASTITGSGVIYHGAVSGGSVSSASYVIGRRTGGLSYSESLRITSLGNVGIGTDSPANQLEVGGEGIIRLRPSTDNTQSALYFNDITSGANSYRSDIGIVNDGGLYFSTTGTINTVPTERMRITSDGNVGIGTTSPTANLEIYKATDGASLRISSGQNNSTHVTTVPFGILEFFSADVSSPGAGVRSSIGSYPVDTAGSGGSNLIFNNTNTSGIFEAMRITSSGNVGIGTTSPTFLNSSYTGLTINNDNNGGFIDFKNGNNVLGRILNNTVDFYIGTVVSAPLIFNTTNMERMRITSSGNVGIGTDTVSSITDQRILQLNANKYATILATSGTVQAAIVANSQNGWGAISTESNHPLIFVTNAVEKMRITPSGRVLIGTPPPTEATFTLDVSGTGRFSSSITAGDISTIRKPNSASQQQLRLTTIADSYATEWAFGNAVNSLDLSIARYNGTSWLADFLRITTAGNVGIGITSPTTKLDVVGTGKFSSDVRAPIFYDSDNTAYYFDGTNPVDSIRVSGNIVAYFSDERLKDIKENIPNAIEKVQSLNGFYYEPNEKAQRLGYIKKLEIGVSAQEVERIFPEIIKDAPIGHGYKTLDYGKLTPLLIEAIKEQQTQIEELKQLVNNITKS